MSPYFCRIFFSFPFFLMFIAVNIALTKNIWTEDEEEVLVFIFWARIS